MEVSGEHRTTRSNRARSTASPARCQAARASGSRHDAGHPAHLVRRTAHLPPPDRWPKPQFV